MLSRDAFSTCLFFDISIHFTTHLIKEIKLLGLVFLHQMYAYERFNGILRLFVKTLSLSRGHATWYKDIVQGKLLSGR
jgi:hypothetical protein